MGGGGGGGGGNKRHVRIQTQRLQFFSIERTGFVSRFGCARDICLFMLVQQHIHTRSTTRPCVHPFKCLLSRRDKALFDSPVCSIKGNYHDFFHYFFNA